MIDNIKKTMEISNRIVRQDSHLRGCSLIRHAPLLERLCNFRHTPHYVCGYAIFVMHHPLGWLCNIIIQGASGLTSTSVSR